MMTATSGNDVEIFTVAGTMYDAGKGNDRITITGNDSSIYGNAGNDIISIGGDAYNVTVEGGKGNDTIFSNGKGNLILYNAGDGKDIIAGFGYYDSIAVDGEIKNSVRSGADTIFRINSGTITVKDSADHDFYIDNNVITYEIRWAPPPIHYFENYSNGVTIYPYYGGNDTIINGGNYVSIVSNRGNDRIYNSGSFVSIAGGAGNDTISLDGAAENTLIEYYWGDGKDTIFGFDDNDSILIDGEIKKSVQSGADVLITVSAASNILTLKDVNIENLAFEDYTVYLKPVPDNEIVLTDKADKFQNSRDDVTIKALGGNDIIKNSGNNVYIDGGAGNDLISIETGVSDVTIEGGKGSDTISMNGDNNLIIYNEGDGNEFIFGFNETDSILIRGGTIRTFRNGGRAVLGIGSGRIILKDIDFEDLAIDYLENEDGYLVYLKPVPDNEIELTDKADKFQNSRDDVTIKALGGKDIIQNTAEKVYIDGGAGNDKISLSADSSGNTLLGGAGNDTIYSNGAGNLIRYKTGEGRDIIFGFGGTDSIAVDGVIKKYFQKGKDVVVAVGNFQSALTLKDRNIYHIKIEDGVISYSDEIIFPLTLTSGKDNETFTVEGATVDAGAGNDKITITGNDSSIYGNAGNDIISIGGEASNVTIEGGTGNDIIYSNGAGNLIRYKTGEGKDIIFGFGGTDSIAVDGVIKKYFQKGKDVVVAVGNFQSALTIKNTNVNDLKIEDNIIGINLSKAIKGTDRGELIVNDEKESAIAIYAYGGNDAIKNYVDEVSIDAGAGHDTIFNFGNDSSIFGNDGNDRILINGEAENVTVEGGAGNDTIYTNGEGNVIIYNDGDGKDVIYGFGGDDVIEINGNIDRSGQRGSDVTLYVNHSQINNITFKNTSIYDLSIAYNNDTAKWEITYREILYDSADILDDDNFMSFEAQIADISEITPENYSAAEIQTQNYNSLAQDTNYLAYSDKDK